MKYMPIRRAEGMGGLVNTADLPVEWRWSHSLGGKGRGV
jgi:hypothetical protein